MLGESASCLSSKPDPRCRRGVHCLTGLYSTHLPAARHLSEIGGGVTESISAFFYRSPFRRSVISAAEIIAPVTGVGLVYEIAVSDRSENALFTAVRRALWSVARMTVSPAVTAGKTVA